jgi:hypothetical protein
MASTPADHVVQTQLNNGLGVILHEDHSAPIVSFWTWYRVGSRNERPGKTGLSHWVEHMQFKGTAAIAKGQIFRNVSRVGGTLNALTSHDWTAYFETVPSLQIDLPLSIESDRMVGSLFAPDEVESERTVILSERQGAENNPGYALYEEVVGAAFRAHPYRHMVIGYESDLRAISRDDLYTHYRRFYQPENAFRATSFSIDWSARSQQFRPARRFHDRLEWRNLPSWASVALYYGDLPASRTCDWPTMHRVAPMRMQFRCWSLKPSCPAASRWGSAAAAPWDAPRASTKRWLRRVWPVPRAAT